MLTLLFSVVMVLPAAAEPLWGAGLDLEHAQPVSREYAQDGKAWRPARFVCDRPDSVVFAWPAKGADASSAVDFAVVRYEKSAPASRTEESYKDSQDGDCAMQKCMTTWRAGTSGKSLYLQESNYRDPVEGFWTGDRYVAAQDPLAANGAGWGEPCSNEHFLSLLCVTARRTVFVTRDPQGGARYRSVNFDPKKSAGVDLTCAPDGVEAKGDLRRFTFKKEDFSYVVEVGASDRAPSARITVKNKEKVLQTEDCAQYLWTELRPDAKRD